MSVLDYDELELEELEVGPDGHLVGDDHPSPSGPYADLTDDDGAHDDYSEDSYA